MTIHSQAFDAVLLVGFGGPEQPEQIRPFLEHVLRGRPVPKARFDAVVHHYELIGGRSPFNYWTELQRAALEQQLHALSIRVPVRAGMWHAPPFCEDVVRELAAAGARKLLVVIMAAFHDRTTVQRYSAVVDEAVRARADLELRVTYAPSPELHEGFQRANAQQLRAAQALLPSELRAEAKVLFTAHSVPTAVGQSSGYVTRFESAAQRIARELGTDRYRCVYQSRSGAPTDAWLEPDVCDALRQEASQGARAAIVAPIGFVCDHVEVLYDLDIEAARVAAELGLTLVRAKTVGTHADYIDALASSVREAWASS